MKTADRLYEALNNIKVGSVCTYTEEWCEKYAPIVDEIIDLKKQKNAVILAHSYVAPEIIYGVADYVGDSYKLSRDALNSSSELIVFCSVSFMAETAKVVNPNKRVYMGTLEGGCSLAESVTAEDVKKMKKKYPNHAFVCYINTTAEVKALCDVCVTSSNVVDIVEAYPNDRIYFLPDALMGKNLINSLKERGVEKEVLLWQGSCYVHEQYDVDMIDYIREQHKGVKVLSHPECDEDVVEHADFTGSTGQMLDYVKKTDYEKYFVLTECGLGDRFRVEFPKKSFVGACSMCRFMKSNDLEQVLHVLKTQDSRYEVNLGQETIEKARICIDEMFRYTEKAKEKKKTV